MSRVFLEFFISTVGIGMMLGHFLIVKDKNLNFGMIDSLDPRPIAVLLVGLSLCVFVYEASYDCLS